MLRAALFALVLAVGSQATARAGHLSANSEKLDKQPTQALARIDEAGRLVIRCMDAAFVCNPKMETRTLTEYVEVQKVRTVTDPQNPAVERAEQYTVKVPVQKAISVTILVTEAVPQPSEVVCESIEGGGWRCPWSESPVRVSTAGNGAENLKSIRSGLQEWRQVILSDDGEEVEPYYAGLFQPGTLVIVLPERPVGMPGYAMPMPVPVDSAPTPHPAVPSPEAPSPQPAPTPPSASIDAEQARLEPVFVSISDEAGSDASFPEGVPPSFAFAVVEGDDVRLRFMTQSNREQTIRGTIRTRDGWVERAPVTARRISRTNQIWTIPCTAVQGFAGDGSPLDERELAMRLSRETTVLISTSGRAVDPFWRTNLRTEATILVTPLPDDAGAQAPMPSCSVGPMEAPAPVVSPYGQPPQGPVPQPHPQPQAPAPVPSV